MHCAYDALTRDPPTYSLLDLLSSIMTFRGQHDQSMSQSRCQRVWTGLV